MTPIDDRLKPERMAVLRQVNAERGGLVQKHADEVFDFAAEQRDRADRFAAVVAQVREQHVPTEEGSSTYCDEDGHLWPCGTARIVDAAAPEGEKE